MRYVSMRSSKLRGGVLSTSLALFLCSPLTALGFDLSSITNSDAAAGLKKALDQGVNRAVSELGTADGFLKNPKVKIDLPPKLAKAQGILRMVGLGGQTDEL